VTVTSGGVCVFDDSASAVATLTIAGIANPIAAAQVAAAGFIVSVDAANNTHDVANRTASANVEIGGVVFTSLTAPTQLAGMTEIWTVNATSRDGVAGRSDLAGADTLTLTLPSGFTYTDTTPTIVMTGAGYATAADCSASATTLGLVATITLLAADADCVANVSTGAAISFTVAGIKNGTAATLAKAGATLVMDSKGGGGVHPSQASLADIEIDALVVAASPTSISADGSSFTTISVSGHGASLNSGGGLISLTTDNGKFLTVPAPVVGHLYAAIAVSLDGKVASGAAVDTYGGVTAASVSLQSPNATGQALVSLRVVPAGGGNSVLHSQVVVTFAAPSAQAKLTTITLGTPSPATIPGATGSAPSTITIDLKDQFGNAVQGGTVVTVTTSLGVIDSNATTCTNPGGATVDAGSDADCKYSDTGAQATIALFGNGVTGVATVTVKATPFGIGETAISKT
jgi:hypothetical protein